MKLSDINLDRCETVDHGYNATIYLVEDDDECFVVKEYGNTATLQKEKAILDHLTSKSDNLAVITPTVLDHDYATDTVLLSHIPGSPPTKPYNDDIWRQYAKGKKAISKTPFEAYGDIDNTVNVVEQHDSAQAYYDDEMHKFIEAIKENQTVNHELLTSIKDVWTTTKQFLQYDKGPVLIQADPSLDNYLYQDNTLQGIVDFEHSRAGNILEDIYQTRNEFQARLDNLDMFTSILLDETPQQKHKQLARTYYLIAQVRMLYLVPRMSWEENVDHASRKKHIVDNAKKEITTTLSNLTKA
jgi:hypothetical protein